MVHDPYWDLDKPLQFPDFDPSKTALLVIDMQRMCAHSDGWMARLARDQGKPDHLKERFEFIAEMLPNLQNLIGFARDTGVEVVFVRIGYRTPDARDGKPGLVHLSEATPREPADLDILAEIRPRPRGNGDRQALGQRLQLHCHRPDPAVHGDQPGLGHRCRDRGPAWN